MITLYIGFDSTNYGQELAYEVCKRSVLRFTKNVKIVKLDKNELQKKKIYTRQNDDGSTEFTYTRFLVPFLNNYEGTAIFCDSDFLWRCDINILNQYINTDKAVFCVKHEYNECLNNLKMDGKKQEWYPRKNWSSLMIFNCSHNDIKKLNINSIKNKSAQWLHRFEWTDDINIGELPKSFNYLLGYYSDINEPNAVHLTDGGPWYSSWYKKLIFTDKKYEIEWLKYLNDYEKEDLKIFLNK